MMDQLMEETIVTLHPDTLLSRQGIAALRRLMQHYATKRPAIFWARMVSAPVWREDRTGVIRAVAEQDWIADTDAVSALQFAELAVMAVEALAGQWTPEQCRFSAVRIDGRLMMSLVCSMEGCAA